MITTILITVFYIIPTITFFITSYLYNGRLFQTGWWSGLIPCWNIVLMVTYLIILIEKKWK